MNKFLILLFISVFTCLIVSLSEEGNPRTMATHFYHDGLGNFVDKTKQLKEISNQYLSSEVTFEAFAEQVKQTRLSFKKIELLAEYFDPQMVGDFINGAPLPKIERKVPNLVVFQPKGLQRLDELSSSPDEVDEDELRKLSKDLYIFSQQLVEVQKMVKFYDRHIFEACRTEILRTFSLGLTGFDTPGNLNCIEEASVSFQSTDYLLGLYMDQLSKSQKELALEMQHHLSGIRAQLKISSFEELDRLELLRGHVLPLYRNILEAEQILGIELPHEVLPKPGPINYLAKSFFDDDFLRAGFYSQISEKDKNPALYTLGEYLFFDPILSENNKMSCASCHKPELAFQDGLAKSLSSNKQGTVARNAPSLLNSVYAVRFFHDMRSHRLQSQIEHVVFSEDEFNTSHKEILQKLASSDEYLNLFQEAFPQVKGEKVNAFTVAQSLTAYVETLRSWNSPFDRYVRAENNTLSEDVKRGFNLFMGKANCGTCHFAPTFAGLVPPLFTDSESEVLGVTKGFDTLNPVLDEDMGRYENGRIKEKVAFYQRSFKTPTVRNIELSAPYMHNGSFETLEEVMQFYNKGGGNGLGLKVKHQTLAEDHLGLNEQELQDIIAFMKSLTDTVNLARRASRLPKFANEQLNNRLQESY